jgi:hypothetical protein
METLCTECRTLYEVGESQKDAHMFCLECDNFFKIEEKPETPDDEIDILADKIIDSSNEDEDNGINNKIKTALKSIFKTKEKVQEPEPVFEFEPDPPKMTERLIGTETRSLVSINDFLEPEADFENQPEDVPAEYIDFLSVGLDVYSSDLIENHGKNKTEDQPPQKEQ